MSIEKQHGTIKTSCSKEINHINVSHALSKLVKIEEKSDNSRLSAFYEFQSE